MIQKEAHDRIDSIITKHEIDDVYVTISSFQDYDALRIARKALEQEPCEDKYIKEIDHLRKYIIKLETQIVEQEPKTGHWYIDERHESDREVVCSNCEQPIFKYHKMDFDYRPKYCPNCGAKMTESEV